MSDRCFLPFFDSLTKMKQSFFPFFQVLCLTFLFTASVFSAENVDPAVEPASKADKAANKADEPASKADEPASKADKIPADPDLTPEAAMIGDWTSFITNRGTPVKLTGTDYRFLASGTWEMIDEADHSKSEPQGWYRIIPDDSKLLLQPHDAAVKEESSAITAQLRDDNSFIIPNPMEDEPTALLFIRKDTLSIPTMSSLAGTWTITQTDLESKEERVAPYTLTLKEDGTYTVQQPDKELPAEWAKGTYTISGIRIQLKNAFSGTGLWNAPAFFLLDHVLRYDNSKYCLRCEKKASSADSDK